MIRPAGFELRPADVGDATAIAEVHRRAAITAYANIFPPFSRPPTTDDLLPGWLELLTDGSSTVFVARTPDAVVGVVALRPDTAVPTGLLLARLYVAPDMWHRGIGSRLHDRALTVAAARADAVNLWVLEGNDRARRMYERRGWLVVPGRFLANDPPEVRDVLYRFDLRTVGSPGSGARVIDRPSTD